MSSHLSTRTGAGTRRGAAAALALFTAACSMMPGSGKLSVSLNDTVESGVLEHVLPTERCGDYFIATAAINGRGPFRLMLDTGFPVTQLHDETARSLGARRSVRTIEIGAQSVRGRIPIGVRDLGAVSLALGTAIDGILGYTTFGDLQITYDYPGDRVLVSTGTLGDGPDVVALSSGDRPFVSGQLDGTTVQFVLDTGFSGGISLRDFDDQHFAVPSRQVGASVRVDGVTPRRGARLSSDVVFGAFTLRTPVVENAERRSLLGQRVLRNFVVTLDRKAGRARFAAPDAGRPVISLPPLRGTGLILAPRADYFEVVAIIEDSPAAQSRVAAGDRVVAIDAAPVADRGCRATGGAETAPRVLTVQRGDEQFDVTIGMEVLVASAAVDSARQLVRALVERESLPGLAVTVSKGSADDAVVWREGFGFADLEAQTPATPETRFRIGSVSKVLTAFVLMRMAQTRSVDLDAPIGQYIAELPPHLRNITLRQLAGHLAGIRHYAGSEFLSSTSFEMLGDALAVFANDTLVAVPGTRYFYSSYGYNLIGAVLEAAADRPFSELVEREVATPTGMRATVPDVRSATIPQRAHTYFIRDTGVVLAPDDDLSGRWPSGGYLSSSDDIARLGRAALGPAVLDSASLALMATPQRLASGESTSVGIGWRVGVDSDGRRYLHHGGSSNGGAAFLLVYPAEQLVVAMASNAFAGWGERDALALAALFLDRP